MEDGERVLKYPKLCFVIYEEPCLYLSWDGLAALLVCGLVGGLLLVHTLLFMNSGALLIRNTAVHLFSLLLIGGAAGLLVLGLVGGRGD